MAPKFADNIILTKTERLMMSNRPPDPKNARNKNVLVVGGSGSGKTRFWLKPNLLQCHSSYVVTDPNGSIMMCEVQGAKEDFIRRWNLVFKDYPDVFEDNDCRSAILFLIDDTSAYLQTIKERVL